MLNSMLKSVEGVYRLQDRGIDQRQAADLQRRVTSFAEDWERAEMNAYDELRRR